MRLTLHLLLLLCGLLPAAAATGVQGTLVDAITGAPVADANVLLANGGQFVTSTSDGHFQMSDCTPGQDQLRIVAFGYKDMEINVDIKKGLVVDLGTLRLQRDLTNQTLNSDDYVFDESQVLEDEGHSQSIGTIQGAVDNIFYQRANYDFSIMRFRMRGYRSEWSGGYINGIDYNDAMRGRFNYSQMGGLTSSAFRNKHSGRS